VDFARVDLLEIMGIPFVNSIEIFRQNPTMTPIKKHEILGTQHLQIEISRSDML
jgi:hypothetical protein